MYDLRVCPALFNLLTHTPYKILLKPINLKFYRLMNAPYPRWVTVGKGRGGDGTLEHTRLWGRGTA